MGAIGVLTAGGDCPGLNAAIRGVVGRVTAAGREVVGIEEGWLGLMGGKTRPLTRDDVRGILSRGGTILGTSRIDPYIHGDGLDSLRPNLERLDIEKVIVIGGDVFSPFFSPGFWNVGFFGYDPWRFSHGWYFGRYGPWGYDPFWSPWGYDPYYDPYWDQRYGRGYGQTPERVEETTGSIRLRVSPESAVVIIDGTQVGFVDDFNGFSDHLELTAGTHQLELRADGYEPVTKTITVRAGKTLTERVSLKKIQ